MDLLRRLRLALEPEVVHAHCDIPCGIYDPHHAQMGAHTVLRMIDLTLALPGEEGSDLEKQNKLMRYVLVKEQHAELVKNEVRILWGDYFTEEHVAQHPELHDLVWRILKQAGKAKQGVDRQAALDLVASVNRFAELFWTTKAKETATVAAPYPTEEPLAVPTYR